uniref:WD repeat-containing protein on Y chromosome n=1 Tax=Oncorhynchus kisutch TaxID=8019 RepID=A0A8C7JM02_ONCKI
MLHVVLVDSRYASCHTCGPAGMLHVILVDQQVCFMSCLWTSRYASCHACRQRVCFMSCLWTAGMLHVVLVDSRYASCRACGQQVCFMSCLWTAGMLHVVLVDSRYASCRACGQQVCFMSCLWTAGMLHVVLVDSRYASCRACGQQVCFMSCLWTAGMLHVVLVDSRYASCRACGQQVCFMSCLWDVLFFICETFFMQHTVAQPIWVTDMVCLSNINQLSISSTGRDVEFYDISASKCDIVFSLSELEANVEYLYYLFYTVFFADLSVAVNLDIIILMVWNPYVTNQATSQMKGHSTIITHIAVNGRDNKIISVSKDKNVRVWDLQDSVCLQNIQSRNVNMGCFPITSTYYNHTSNTMVMATYLIGVLRGSMEDANCSVPTATTSHEQPLCAALYNSNFKQVVSGCHAGVVSVWDILTGEKVMQFQTTPERPVEVTAMAFDGPKRRLITGSKDGTLRLWNFNNGALLSELPLVDSNEVTGILYINERIYVSGWSKRMEHRVWNQYHSDDIYSMHAHGSKMLVTASYSGDVIVWNIDSGQAFCRFNASESPLPLVPIRVRRDTMEQTRPGGDCYESRRFGEGGSGRYREPDSQPSGSSSQLCQPCTHQRHTGTHGVWRMSMTVSPSLSLPISLSDEQVLFLATRERSPDTAILLTSSADGYIYAWSIGRNGGLLGKFRAVHSKGPVICAMSTDRQDQILLTGDSNGYITLWDIEKYCYRMRGGVAEEESSNEDSLRLPQLIPPYCKVEGPRRLVVEQVKEVTQQHVSLIPPRPLSSWRCHLKGIVHLEYVERFRLIVTASLDCNVRLWTTAGRYIGKHHHYRHCSYVYGVISLRTSYGSICAKRILEGLTAQKSQQSTKFGGVTTQLRELVPTDPRIVKYTDEQIENTWRLWQEKGRQVSYRCHPHSQ